MNRKTCWFYTTMPRRPERLTSDEPKCLEIGEARKKSENFSGQFLNARVTLTGSPLVGVTSGLQGI